MSHNNSPTIWHIFGQYLKDALAPVRCVGCNRLGRYICSKCLISLQPPANTCPVQGCLRLTDHHQFCREHKSKFELSALIFATGYHEPLVREAINLWKYHGVKAIGDELGVMLSAEIASHLPHSKCLITVVPLHTNKLRLRGFNQADQLAEIVSNVLKIPKLDLLTRTKHTYPQAKLEVNQRISNVTDVFAATKSNKIKGKTIILVDDVSTTISTLNHAALALKAAGAKSVIGAVIAHG